MPLTIGALINIKIEKGIPKDAFQLTILNGA
jgi:hypothetical protein